MRNGKYIFEKSYLNGLNMKSDITIRIITELVIEKMTENRAGRRKYASN